MSKTQGAVYIDSPISAAVRQVAPFFRQGVFCDAKTPLFMRRRIGSGFGLTAGLRVRDMVVKPVGRETAGHLPVRRGGAVFYPFNGQGNLHTVANRSYRHVLILHGESNKRASARPAARLYDYVCVAGPLAIERYLAGGIFRTSDVEEGRLIQVGDTFVQPLEGCRADPGEGSSILYAPTWEGFGGALNDYSSAGRGGIAMADEALRLTGRNSLVIRPHPYLGLLQPGLAFTLVREAAQMARRRKVLFDLSDSNFLVRSLVRGAMLARPVTAGGTGVALASGDDPVALCLCDVSAMEAICLKAGLPHVVLDVTRQLPLRLQSLYRLKSAVSPFELCDRLPAYLADPEAVDAPHRDLAFSVSHPDLAAPEGAARIDRLLNIVAANDFWR